MHTRPPLTHMIRRGAIVAPLALFAVFAAALTATLLARSAHVNENEIRRTLLLLEDVGLEMRTMQSATRAAIISDNPELLAPYSRAERTLDANLRRLQRGVAERYPGPFAAMQRSVEAWRGLNQRQLLRLQIGRRAEARRVTASGRGEDAIRRAERSIDPLIAEEEARSRSERQRLNRWLLLITIALGIVGPAVAFAGLLLSRQLTREVARPLRRIGAAALTLGSGDLRARAPVEGVTEVAELAATFNAMAAQTEQLVEELRRTDEARAGLVSAVSHELRTPLTSIRGYSDLLAEGEAGPLTEEQLENLEVVQRNASRLESVISDLLVLGRVDAGRLALKRETVDLGTLARGIAEELDPIATSSGVQIEVSAPSVEVVADRGRLHQAFTNLVANAIKFSPAGSSVVVRDGRRDGEVFLEVADHGVGIPEDELGRLTERFFRASTAGGVEGTGLGLSITRGIAEAHGGQLEIESSVGAGSTFRVVLPAGG